MKSTSNFLPALGAGNASPRLSPRMATNINSSDVKLENRVFYMEKAVARLIHAFESMGGRLNKIESDNSNNNVNIGALSKTLKDVTQSNKDFISKQHMVTERVVSDIHKTQHHQQQQTSFVNKELSDIRDSIQALSSTLQRNFNEAIKAGMQQCNDLNVQNSNSIQSLRKITDQKISHLQQLLVDSQKRAQTQNSSILDIINSNQKSQTEFQNSFKTFFQKFRDSMHQNLTALQESSQEQISYLDNVLRAEVKTRMKSLQQVNKEMDEKLFKVEEIINQNQRDAKRSWEYVNKQIESVKEQQKHQQTANQPLHQIITNLTKQFDEMSQQHLTDIKSMMQLNQDTSEKQFNQIKSLQIQIQHIYSKLSRQDKQQQPMTPNAVTFMAPSSTRNSVEEHEKQYQVMRPSSYKSDMSSTAAFDAIKYHLANMPRKPNAENDGDADVDDNEFEEYLENVEEVTEENTRTVTQNVNVVMESQSQFQEMSSNVSPVHGPERMPIDEQQEEEEEANYSVHEEDVQEKEEQEAEDDDNNYENDEYEEQYEEENEIGNDNAEIDAAEIKQDDSGRGVSPKQEEVGVDDVDKLLDEPEVATNVEEAESETTQQQTKEVSNVLTENEAEQEEAYMDDVDNMLHDDDENQKEAEVDANEKEAVSETALQQKKENDVVNDIQQNENENESEHNAETYNAEDNMNDLDDLLDDDDVDENKDKAADEAAGNYSEAYEDEF